jgi:sarcosine oxidase/L-pipecolate oxidase
MSPSQSLAIIGSGTFGLSTALAWRKTHPSAPITLIDTKPLPNTPTSPTQILPASEDIGKIIRAAYASPIYASLGREALAIWRTEKPYKDFFHASGWITANALAGGISISEGGRIGRGRFDEAFPDSRLEERYVISEDDDPGWVEASRCLEAVRKMALDQGVEYYSGEAVELLWDGKRCTGVKMRDGREIRAENVLMATGAWTPGFLRRCGVVADIQCEIAGVTTVGVELDEEQYGKYRDMPILAVPGEGEYLFKS